MHIEKMSLKEALFKYPQCAKMIICDWSGMGEIIIHYPELHSKIKAFLAIDNNMKVIGWSWLIPKTHKDFTKTYYFMVLVEKTRKKIGKKLFMKAKDLAQSHHRRLKVFPWDLVSEKFFTTMKVKEENKIRNWNNGWYYGDLK